MTPGGDWSARRRVVVVGGGLAGLAAASALAPFAEITLLEARRSLGGRASSFVDTQTGELLDNCQHVSMNCCTNLAHFAQETGIDPLFETHPTLLFRDESGDSRFGGSFLPAPFHLMPALLRARFLTLTDKFQIARGMLALMRSSSTDEDEPFERWLDRHHQSKRVRDRFWGVVLVSALNETLDRMGFRYARKVFVDGFLRSPVSYQVLVPRVTLGELYGDRLESNLTQRQVTIMKGKPVKSIVPSVAKDEVLIQTDDESIVADDVILAVAHHRVRDLLSEASPSLDATLSGIDEIESSPITSVHVWYDGPVMDEPSIVVVGKEIQWLFRRPGLDLGAVQAVISASRELSSRGKEEIERLVLQEIRELLPRVRTTGVRHARVVTERRATISVTPGVDRLRPTAKTSVRGIWLAGDYTQTDWPATMEGAVVSGYRAAAAVTESWGTPRTFEQPPLPMSWLTKWLVRS